MRKTNKVAAITNIMLKDLEKWSQQMPGSIYSKDLHGKYLGCNESFRKMLGISSAKLIVGKTDYELWNIKSEIDTIHENDAYTLKVSDTLCFEEKVTLPDGKQIHFIASKKPLMNEAGSIVGIVGNSLEITEIKIIQHELQKEKQHAEIVSRRVQHYLEIIVDSLPGSIYWKNREGVYLGCNAFMVRTAGLNSPADIIGKTDFQLWLGQAKELRLNDEKVMSSAEPLRIEETVKLQ